MNRWEKVLHATPVPLRQHLLDEAARIFANDLCQWPLPAGAFEDVDAPPARPADAGEPPGKQLYFEAFRLARWDLAREFDAYDEYIRNTRWIERGVAPHQKATLLLVSQFMVEQVLSLVEATEGRIRRADAPQILEKTEQYFLSQT